MSASPRDYEMRLRAMRQFEPLWRVIAAERERFPDLPRMFTSGLEMGRWELGWEDDPTPAIAMAALTGYSQLSRLDESPYQQIAADDFIAALVEMMVKAGVMPPTRKD